MLVHIYVTRYSAYWILCLLLLYSSWWCCYGFCCCSVVFSWGGGSTYMLTPDAYLCYILQVPGKLLRSWCQCSHLDWNNNYVCKSCKSALNVWVISFTTCLINVIFTFTLLTSKVGVFTNSQTCFRRLSLSEILFCLRSQWT